jgi:hypothetical protein
VHGVIFVALHQHLRELGDEDLRRQCFPEPGAYLAFREYPDADVLRIARCIADHVPSLAQPIGEVLRSIGEEIPAAVKRTTPALLPRVTTLQGLLELLDEEEPDGRVVLPRFRVIRGDEERVTLEHLGDSGVCRFDEGLLIGLAAINGERVAMRHPSCRQRRDEKCLFVPRVSSGEPARRNSMTLRFAPQEPTDKDGA